MKRRYRYWLLTGILGLLSIGVVVLVGVPGLGQPQSGVIDQRAAASYRPQLSKYADIPLPIEAPPAGAVVHATGYADTAASGEQISFEYPGFTISACSVDLRTADAYACATQPGTVELRSVRSGPRVTSYSSSTKFGTPPSGHVAAKALAFFKTCPVAPRPEWMHDYIESGIKELFGSSSKKVAEHRDEQGNQIED